jgi:hypothetical protein
MITCQLWAACQAALLPCKFYYSKLYTFAESTVWNCDPCGTNLILFPLSTGPNFGDPIHFSFYYNTSTGQTFKTPSGTYRVTNI